MFNIEFKKKKLFYLHVLYYSHPCTCSINNITIEYKIWFKYSYMYIMYMSSD